MKTTTILIAFAVLLTATVPARAELPRSLLGLTMGEDVSEFEHLLWMDSATKLADTPFLMEVDIRDTEFPGIRGGSVTYGTCANPGVLLGAKLKFDDRSYDLFEELYNLYEKRFGKPDEWQGDPFRTVRSWKWMETEGDTRINIVLTHSKDPGMRPGVSIKLDMHTLWMTEYECYHRALEEKRPEPKPVPANKLELSRYVPHPPAE